MAHGKSGTSMGMLCGAEIREELFLVDHKAVCGGMDVWMGRWQAPAEAAGKLRVGRSQVFLAGAGSPVCRDDKRGSSFLLQDPSRTFSDKAQHHSTRAKRSIDHDRRRHPRAGDAKPI